MFEHFKNRIPLYGVFELKFKGPFQTAADRPAKDIEFFTQWEHEDKQECYKIYGFWDGDGRGGNKGDVFKVRFSPTRVGRWHLVNTHSNIPLLNHQSEKTVVNCIPSKHPGFWIPSGRWFKRSNGTFKYFHGNTHYDFLSLLSTREILSDIRKNARYYAKLRFCLMSFRQENKRPPLTFLTDAEAETSDREIHSDRPNPEFFYRKVDPAIQESYRRDLICDLILGGSIDDQTPDHLAYLKYVVARYGAYPNVWITVGQEWDEQRKPDHQKQVGEQMHKLLAYPTPLSTHPVRQWEPALNGGWNTHAIIQMRAKKIGEAARDIINTTRSANHKPCVNDEIGYQGAAETMERDDVLEAHLGAFLGGGYATSGEKKENKVGQYFFGGFNVREHTVSVNLKFMADYINKKISFWKLAPGGHEIFNNLPEEFVVLGDRSAEFVIGTNRAVNNLVAHLPVGTWQITAVDLVAMKKKFLGKKIKGDFVFDSSSSRAGMIHFKRR